MCRQNGVNVKKFISIHPAAGDDDGISLGNGAGDASPISQVPASPFAAISMASLPVPVPAAIRVSVTNPSSSSSSSRNACASHSSSSPVPLTIQVPSIASACAFTPSDTPVVAAAAASTRRYCIDLVSFSSAMIIRLGVLQNYPKKQPFKQMVLVKYNGVDHDEKRTAAGATGHGHGGTTKTSVAGGILPFRIFRIILAPQVQGPSLHHLKECLKTEIAKQRRETKLIIGTFESGLRSDLPHGGSSDRPETIRKKDTTASLVQCHAGGAISLECTTGVMNANQPIQHTGCSHKSGHRKNDDNECAKYCRALAKAITAQVRQVIPLDAVLRQLSHSALVIAAGLDDASERLQLSNPAAGMCIPSRDGVINQSVSFESMAPCGFGTRNIQSFAKVYHMHSY